MAHKAVAVSDPLIIKDLAGLMRLMTIDADGNAFWLLFPQFTFDYFAVHTFDARVALQAGGYDILLGDRRTRILGRQNVMRTVARNTGRAGAQSFFE